MSKDRRKNRRLPLTISVATPMRIEMHSEHYDGQIPGIMVNLSGGGIAMLVFHHLPEESRVEFDLECVGVNEKIWGKIVREKKKYEDTYMVGIKFERKSEKLEEVVEKMAEDHDICEVRYLLDPKNACYPECKFRLLCGKRIKKDFPEEKS